MDEAVRLALAKWPDVPDCHGWLRLTRRGEWKLPDGLIRHEGLKQFIGRNYAALPDGRWYFQNGPQRVFVGLDYTPIIARLKSQNQLETHTGLGIVTLRGAWLDEEGSLLLDCEHGIALLDDRDLADLVPHLSGDLETPENGLNLTWSGRTTPVTPIQSTGVPARFGFVSEPA